MNHDTIAGELKQLGGRCLMQWAALFSDRRTALAGRALVLSGTAQARHGAEREAAARQLREFVRRNRNWNSSASR